MPCWQRDCLVAVAYAAKQPKWNVFWTFFLSRRARVHCSRGVELSMHRCRCELWVWVDEALRKCGSFDECNLQAISEWGRVGDRSALPWLAVARASHSIHTTLSSLTECFQEIYQIITICTQIPKELNDVKLIILIKFVHYSYIYKFCCLLVWIKEEKLSISSIFLLCIDFEYNNIMLLR